MLSEYHLANQDSLLAIARRNMPSTFGALRAGANGSDDGTGGIDAATAASGSGGGVPRVRALALNDFAELLRTVKPATQSARDYYASRNGHSGLGGGSGDEDGRGPGMHELFAILQMMSAAAGRSAPPPNAGGGGNSGR